MWSTKINFTQVGEITCLDGMISGTPLWKLA